MKHRLSRSLSALALLGVTCAALQAQWRTQQIQLTPGWNSVFLEVDPESRVCDDVLQGIPVESVWLYSARAAAPQFVSDPRRLTPESPDWLVHVPASANPAAAAVSTLFAMPGGRPYLVKLAAHRAGRAGYLCVATAASMDGYTAFGASITHEGAKQTFDCPAPRAVIADLAVIREAPEWMTAAGYADLAAKITAGADWILADALGAEPIDPRAWAIVQGGLRDALADPAGARAGHLSALGPLVEGLMLGGFAMQWSKSSRPASGAEHQFSHLWDMEHHVHRGEAPSHGFKVGVATLAVTRFYEALLAHDFSALDPDRCLTAWRDPATVEAAVRAQFAATGFVATAVAETRAKHVPPAALRDQLERLREGWPGLADRLRAQLLPAAELERRLRLAGAPVDPEEIGIAPARLHDTFHRAYHIRRRFTVLDVAVRTRTMDTLIGRAFGARTAPPAFPA